MTRLNPGTKLLTRFKNSPFAKNVATLAGGTGVAQAISIFTAPIVTRIYTPSDYGILALYMLVTGLLISFATMQYNNAIIVEKDDEIAKNLLELIIIIAGILSATLFFVLLNLKRQIALLLNSPELENWLLLTPFSIFINAWSIAFMALANRTKAFILMSKNRIISALLVPIVSIGLGLIIKGPTGLIIGLVFGQSLAALLLSNYFFRTQGFRFIFNKDIIKQSAIKHINFPKYSLASEFIYNFTNQIPILMLGKYFGSASVGHFNLSNRLLGMPVGFLAGSVSEVFRQRASEDYKNTESCEKIFLKTLKTLSLISIVPFTIIFLFGPQIFSFAFGKQWIEAGNFAQIMSILFFFKFTISPLTYVFFISQKQKVSFILQVIRLVGLLLSFIITYALTSDVFITLYVFVSYYCLIYLVFLILSWRYSKNE